MYAITPDLVVYMFPEAWEMTQVVKCMSGKHWVWIPGASVKELGGVECESVALDGERGVSPKCNDTSQPRSDELQVQEDPVSKRNGEEERGTNPTSSHVTHTLPRWLHSGPQCY